MNAWIAALAGQAILAWRLPAGPVRMLHTWQVASGLALMVLRWHAPDWYAWAWACWWPANAVALAYACNGRARLALSLGAWLLLAAVALGSAWHFQREPITVYSLRWLVSTIVIGYWIGAAWPDRWLLAYALLSFSQALVGAWVWFTWPALYSAQQWAQVALFVAWAWCPKTTKADP